LLCTARSGSTLLRYCLDSHPDIACPPEGNLAGAFCSIQHLVGALRQEGSDPSESQTRADALCRGLAHETLGYLAQSQGKKRWCDKSLPSVGHADLLSRVFPEAQFISLYRHCADFVVSAVEACPWGFHAYGFEPYVRQSPDNFVFALTRYWADATEAQARFAETHELNTISVRYEDLVGGPGDTLQRLFNWLGVVWQPRYATPEFIFRSRHSSLGPGDHKIAYTSQFDPSSIGQGWRIPLGLLPPSLKDRVNQLLSRLDYQALDYVGLNQDSTGAKVGGVTDGGAQALLEFELAPRLERMGTPLGSGFIRLVVVDLPGQPWIVDFHNRQLRRGDEPKALSIKTTEATLLRIWDRKMNPAVAIRAGDLSIQPADDMTILDREVLVDAFCRLLQPLEPAKLVETTLN
jgi:protein-tyrosine sulfotransferase